MDLLHFTFAGSFLSLSYVAVLYDIADTLLGTIAVPRLGIQIVLLKFFGFTIVDSFVFCSF